MLSALAGTAYLVLGSACISDIYKPTERGTALAWFLNGTLIGQSFGPFVGGVIVTFHSWRALFWFQSALAGLTALLAIAFLPETSHRRRADELEGLVGARAKVVQVWRWANPFRVLALLLIPKLFGMAAASLVWNMQALLTPIRYVINPRFHLTTPLQSGLFFLAPGCGFFFGTYAGGRWADRTVRLWVVERRGRRVPEDRLRSALVAMGAVIPACIVIYGWAIETEKGGVPLPVVCMFVQGFAQVIAFPSINTYCLDVFKGRSAEVIAGNYFFRYAIAAVGTAVCLPAIESIGVGWFSTITALFVFFSAVAVYFVVIVASREDYKAHGERV
ncbi:Dityrosine transporter 1 [Colletotrichum tanaceti]|uniref:Dityrosine transporter 1 n=1 Tax=Colletotrichum tanaceti TaxID=1306861 RepID=A0A4U6X671_9PEZI|nr:Dityrosine transporter 1 [Colletotrichum tanaceti]